MAIEGNSIKDREAKKEAPKVERTLAPVADGKIERRKPSLLEKWFKEDSGIIKEFVIESIIMPAILDGVSGIGDIIIDSLSRGVEGIFEHKGFLSKSGKSRDGYTDYSRRSRRVRRDRDVDRDDDYEDDERSYNNVRLKSEREARNVIKQLKDLIADREYGYATVANLYELTDNIVVATDHRWGWTKLSQDIENYYVRTRHPKKPWLLRLPEPKDLSNFK